MNQQHNILGRREVNETLNVPMDIDWNEVERLAQRHCNGVEIAGRLGIHPNTLYENVKLRFGVDWREYLRQKKADGKTLLREKQFEVALNGDKTMLVWLGKQYLDQADKKEVTTIVTDTEKHARRLLAIASANPSVNLRELISLAVADYRLDEEELLGAIRLVGKNYPELLEQITETIQ